MAKYKVAGNTTVQVDNSVGVLRDITAHVTEIETFGKQVNEVDDTVLSDTAESVIDGIEASQGFSIKGFLDDTATTGSDVVLNNIVGLIGTVKVTAKTGVRSFQAEMLCTSYKMTPVLKEYVMFEATFKQDGAVTVGT